MCFCFEKSAPHRFDVAHFLCSFVLFSRGDAAPYVTLGLVFVQHLLDLQVQRSVKGRQTLLNILVYRGFTDAELPGGAPDCCLVFYDVKGQLAGPLLNISLQRQHAPFCVTATLYEHRRTVMIGFCANTITNRSQQQFFLYRSAPFHYDGVYGI